MPEIVLPWIGEETGFTLNELDVICPKCKGYLEQIRGRIYEAFGVVEMELGGLCPKCNHVVRNRCRIYPKTGEFAQITEEGWKRIKMMKELTFKQRWFRETMRSLMPMAGGISVAIMISLVATNPTKWTYIGWGIVFAIMTTLSIVSGYLFAKKRGD